MATRYHVQINEKHITPTWYLRDQTVLSGENAGCLSFDTVDSSSRAKVFTLGGAMELHARLREKGISSRVVDQFGQTLPNFGFVAEAPPPNPE